LLFDKLWKQRLSVDLICGLPGETEASIMKSLEFLVQKNISHISFYSLCVEEETPLGKAIIENTQSYSQDFSDELWIKGRDYLLENGYEQYEVSNFCKEENECLHNMTYWTHKDYLACGSGGTGTVYENNGEGMRYTNTKNIKEYINFWLNPEQKTGKNDVNVPQDVEKIIHQTSKFEYFMMALRTKRGLSPKEYEAIFNERIPPEILTKLKNTCLQTPQGFFYLSSEKLLFLNSLLEDILSLLD
jgi:oxygen-independent coproporphyrinogen-3 oxidase